MDQNLGFWLYIIYIYVLIVIKLCYVVSLVIIKVDKSASKQLEELNDISKNMFMGMLAVLMIYLFHPRTNIKMVIIQGETKLLLFMFGILSLLELPWDYVYNKVVGKTDIGLTSNQFSIALGGIITAIVTGLIFLTSG
jgi:hypothetical protein